MSSTTTHGEDSVLDHHTGGGFWLSSTTTRGGFRPRPFNMVGLHSTALCDTHDEGLLIHIPLQQVCLIDQNILTCESSPANTTTTPFQWSVDGVLSTDPKSMGSWECLSDNSSTSRVSLTLTRYFFWALQVLTWMYIVSLISLWPQLITFGRTHSLDM